MKKLILYITILAAPIFYSCQTEDTGDVSKVTNYAVFTLSGEDLILLHKGEEYVEPGATAEEAGEPVDVTVTSSGRFKGGSLDTNTPDIYDVYYTAVNQDGFEANATRTVIVADNGDLMTDIGGLYISTVVRDGDSNPQYANMKYIFIWEKSNGTFELSDGIGGYYDIGRGYGPNYAARGATVTVNAPGDFSFGPSFGVGNFGGNAEITKMTTNPNTKTIDFTTEWDAGYTFDVHLEQVQF